MKRKSTVIYNILMGIFLLALSGCGDSSSNISGPAPSVTTVAATDVTAHSAVIHARVNPSGSTTTIYWEWGTSPTLAYMTPWAYIDSGNDAKLCDYFLSGLATGTTYYYRVVANGSAGGIMSFTTL